MKRDCFFLELAERSEPWEYTLIFFIYFLVLLVFTLTKENISKSKLKFLFLLNFLNTYTELNAGDDKGDGIK